MATLTFKSYIPKDKSFQIDSSNVPVEVPPALGRAASNNNWCQMSVGDSKTIVQDAQALRDDLTRTQAALIAENNGSNNDTNNDFHPLTHPPAPKYNHISVEERLSIKNTVKKGNNPPGSRGSRAPGNYNKSIELGTDNKSEGDDSSLNTGHAYRMVDSGKPGSDAFNLEHLPVLPNYTASEHDMRQKHCSSILPYTRTSLLSQNEDRKRNRENIDHSDPDESGDGDSLLTRWKVSAPLGGKTAPNSRYKRSRRSPLLTSEEGAEVKNDDGTDNISMDTDLASTARTTPALESVPLSESQQLIDADSDWEVRQIIGREDVDGVLHYLVDWVPTLLPKHSLGGLKEMVDKFEAQLRAQRPVKNRRGGPGLKRGKRAVVQADASDGPQQKRRRGRPRKQNAKLDINSELISLGES